MKPFLRLIAEAYIANERDTLSDTCFVFPTKRAGQFFLHYLGHEAASGQFMIMPEVITMGAFCSRFTPLAESSRLDELCVLYNEYSELSSEIPDFDRFRFWGDMILDDFSDVDRYLADASRLFTNVSRYKEISSDYLTPEQREIIRQYWPDLLPPDSDGNFWRHYSPNGSDDDSRDKFLKLWEVLGPLYDRFNKAMERAGMITGGRVYRTAAEAVSRIDAVDLPYRRYVFAGFGVLSSSELKIFRHMQRTGTAHFYWDCDLPLLGIPGNRAMQFIGRYRKEFPPHYDLSQYDDADPTVPAITVTGVPSSSGQARMAGKLLGEWRVSGAVSDASNAMDTAVVLADEASFIPLIHSIPADFTSLNVTMGMPLRQTPIASLMHDIVSMQLRARKVRGDYRFYYEDLRRVVSNQYVRRIDPEGCDTVLRKIDLERLYTIDATQMADMLPSVAAMFRPVKNECDFNQVLDYVISVVQLLTSHIDREDNVSRRLDLHFMNGYLQAVATLRATLMQRGISVGSSTALQLVERIVNGERLHFEGRPLEGLQIMGISDTRTLDFDNIILMSMNEKIFPRRNSLKSFIPENIRRAFGLPTSDFVEASGAFAFFRLISRARNVAIYYDSRNSGVGASEMSRYVSQLLYLSDLPAVKHQSASFSTTTFDALPLAIRKTPAVMERMAAFRQGAETPRWLSASAINHYINCPMMFYLTYVEGIRIDEEIVEYMDSSTYGNVVHMVAQRIYTDIRGSRPEALITSDMLRRIIADHAYIDKLVTQAINHYHNKRGEYDNTPLAGETRVLGGIIKRFITEMLRNEMSMAPFTFIDAEMERRLVYNVTPDLSVNVVMFIDRVDRLSDGRLRFVDYKTGNDTIRFSSLDQLFDPSEPDRRKAVLQLLLYANLYRVSEHYEGPVQPFIYRLKSIFLEGLNPVVFNKKIFDDYRQINEEFISRLNSVLVEMFDPEVPFRQAVDAKACKYCAFKSICCREES